MDTKVKETKVKEKKIKGSQKNKTGDYLSTTKVKATKKMTPAQIKKHGILERDVFNYTEKSSSDSGKIQQNVVYIPVRYMNNVLSLIQ